jgi:hypothetical protein
MRDMRCGIPDSGYGILNAQCHSHESGNPSEVSD